jgi:hypothetical protein
MPPRAPVLRRLLRPGRSRYRGPSGWRRRRSLLAVGQCSWSSVILCGGRNSCGLCHHERDRSPPRPAHAPARIASSIEINRGTARITGRNVLGRTFLGRSFLPRCFYCSPDAGAPVMSLSEPGPTALTQPRVIGRLSSRFAALASDERGDGRKPSKDWLSPCAPHQNS